MARRFTKLDLSLSAGPKGSTTKKRYLHHIPTYLLNTAVYFPSSRLPHFYQSQPYLFLTSHSAAFILYRQHHQQAVVAQNPGLANPEISKIIGDHWRNAASETKEHWKLLAHVRKQAVPDTENLTLTLTRKRSSATRNNTLTIDISHDVVSVTAPPLAPQQPLEKVSNAGAKSAEVAASPLRP